MSRGEALTYYMDKAGFNARDLSRASGVAYTTIRSMIERDLCNASIDNTIKICKALGIKVADILDADKKVGVIYESPTTYQSKNSYTYYPTSISAGLPLTVENTEATKITIANEIMGKYVDDKEIFFARINGDSMNRLMDDGTLIAIKPTPLENLRNGDIVVFSHNHEYSVKHIYKTANTVIFKPNSTNDCHHEQHFDFHDEITIHGKVVTYIINLD